MNETNERVKKKIMKTHANTPLNEDAGAQLRSEQLGNTNSNPAPFLPGMSPKLVKPFRFPAQPYEYKITPLRECPTPMDLQTCDTPEKVAAYWHMHVVTNPYFDPERECLAVLLLNTRRRAKGHQLVSIGTLDTLLVSPAAVFRLAIMTSAAAIVLAHQHPSGDCCPSEADIKVTRDLIRAGQLLKIEVLDHVVIGRPRFSSLRALGYFSF